MLKNWYKQAKAKYELLKITICISNVLHYQYMDLFSHVFHVFSYLITDILTVESLYC